MGKRRFVWDDRHAHEPLGNDLDVRRKNDQERGKRTGRLCEADLVYPDDMLVDIRNFSAVMVGIGDLVAVMAVRRKVTMGDGGVIGRIRLVHVLACEHGRQGEPWHQRRDNQDSANRSHRAVDYMPQVRACGKLTKNSETLFRVPGHLGEV